jgi:hypothetical protein
MVPVILKNIDVRLAASFVILNDMLDYVKMLVIKFALARSVLQSACLEKEKTVFEDE